MYIVRNAYIVYNVHSVSEYIVNIAHSVCIVQNESRPWEAQPEEYTYMYTWPYMYIYISVYIGRERQRERGRCYYYIRVLSYLGVLSQSPFLQDVQQDAIRAIMAHEPSDAGGLIHQPKKKFPYPNYSNRQLIMLI